MKEGFRFGCMLTAILLTAFITVDKLAGDEFNQYGAFFAIMYGLIAAELKD